MRKNQSLPALRKICGFTQADLAAEIGVSTRTIVAVENGTRSLTEVNARKITYATGVLPESLIDGDLPLALDGKPYTQKHLELWKKPPDHGFLDVPSQVESARDAIKVRFETLLEATLKSGPGPAFYFAEEFQSLIDRMLKNPKIKERYSELLPPDNSESLESIVKYGMIFALWEVVDMDQPEDLLGDPFGVGYGENQDD